MEVGSTPMTKTREHFIRYNPPESDHLHSAPLAKSPPASHDWSQGLLKQIGSSHSQSPGVFNELFVQVFRVLEKRVQQLSMYPDPKAIFLCFHHLQWSGCETHTVSSKDALSTPAAACFVSKRKTVAANWIWAIKPTPTISNSNPFMIERALRATLSATRSVLRAAPGVFLAKFSNPPHEIPPFHDRS